VGKGHSLFPIQVKDICNELQLLLAAMLIVYKHSPKRIVSIIKY